MKIRRAWTVMIKEFEELFRNRLLLRIFFFSPIVQLIIFGYAATYDIKKVPTGVLDHDRSAESRELINRMNASGYFKILYYPDSPDEVDHLIQTGRIWCAVAVPDDYSEKLRQLQGASLGISFDAANSNSASIAASYLNRLISHFSQNQLVSQLRTRGVAPGNLGMVENQIRVWYNPDLESRNYNVPAVVMQILVVFTLLLTAMAIVREREYGTMEQLVVTPIRASELIIGKALPYIFIALFDVTLICSFAIFYFQVPFVGSLWLLYGASLLFVICMLATGLLISTISSTQQQAMITAFLFIMPASLLSGFAFPLENMPKLVQYLTYLNPQRYFVVIMRALFLKGSNLEMLLPQLVPLALIGTAVLVLAVLRFRKRAR